MSDSKDNCFATFCQSLSACSQAVNFARGKTAQQAWDTCERADWMFWLCRRMQNKSTWPSESDILIASYAATIDIVLAFTPTKETRPIAAMDAMLAYALNPCSEKRQAWTVAGEAAWAAIETTARGIARGTIWTATGEAVWEAVWVAIETTVQGIARGTIWAAAKGVARGAARDTAHKYMCDIIRQYLWVGETK